MKTLEQLKAELKAIDDKLTEMRDVCIREERNPSEEEREAGTKLVGEAKELEAVIEYETDALELHERTKKIEDRKIIVDPNAAGTRSAQEFRDSGEFFAAVMQAGLPGGVTDPRLLTRAGTGLSEAVPSDGGFLVPVDMATEILKQTFETGLLASRCREINITGNSLKMNGIDETSRVAGSRWGGIRGYWAAEGSEKTASKPKFRQIQLTLKKMIGLCYATDELLDDAAALESVIRQGFAEEFAFMIDEAIIEGTGAGQPLGIVNAGCLVSVAIETGQAAKTLVYENIVNIWSRIFAASRPNAVWLINQDVEPQLNTMSLAVGTGGQAVYMPASGASGSPYSTLMGRPVIPIEHCETLGTKGDIYLADFNGYLLAKKGGTAVDVSIHVRFIYDEQVYRFVVRVDGQPQLASAITPKNGSNTLSHFVALNARA